jgi:uncharacterized protein DUF3597
MGLFSTILEKLGFGPSTAHASPPSQPGAAPKAAPTMEIIDVVGHLERLAASNSQQLNWQTSIVDLLKLLGLDSSMPARKGLATELGCPAEKLGDSAQMNLWLHRTVLQKLAANGGNIPKELLH